MFDKKKKAWKGIVTMTLITSNKLEHPRLHQVTHRHHLVLAIILSLLRLFYAADRLHPGESITSNQTLSSSTGAFTLGFFSLSKSDQPNTSRDHCYLGIWRSGSPASFAVWVANRESPIPLTSAVFRLSNTTKNLEVADSNGTLIWSSSSAPPSNDYSTSISEEEAPLVAVVLDRGEVVLYRGGTSAPLWRSFAHLGNTLLPKAPIWANYRTHESAAMTSWKSPEDPSPGKFGLTTDPYVFFQGIVWRVAEDGKKERWFRTNVWSGHSTTVIKTLGSSTSVPFFFFSFSDHWMNISFNANEELSGALAGRVEYNGSLDVYIWVSTKWTKIYSFTEGRCDLYGPCGPFSYCQRRLQPKCICLQGFRPRNQEEWDADDFKGGCIRRDALACEDARVEKPEEGFVRYEDMKVPDFNVYLPHAGNVSECREACRANCSCQAYSYVDLANGSGTQPRCLVWFGELLDLVFKNDTTGETLFVRLPTHPAPPAARKSGGKKGPNVVVAVIVPLLSGFGLLVSIAYLTWRLQKRRGPNESGRDRSDAGDFSDGNNGFIARGRQCEQRFMDYEIILTATGNFSDGIKLGQGGFGTVYKGILQDGQEVAIKRLCRESSQGFVEFENEVALMVQLQHRNLTKLLNFCIHNGEKILIYEYMPNKSLDRFLFDVENESLLDWAMRLNIIKGIAKGLLYLHEESRLKVIHRDLKASNILLDEDMNPKISDFGMARIFQGGESEANTRRIVGTGGYISPEYAMEGVCSVRSDAYSFGVLVLEIVSGKRNINFRLTGEYPSILSYAWELWSNDRLMEMVDPRIRNSVGSMEEVRKCVHIGLLCVQDDPSKRPNMSNVLFLFENQGLLMESMPEQPMFTGWTFQNDNAQQYTEAFSINNLSVTIMEGR